MFLKSIVETQEHAPSYYAATANIQSRYPQLQDDLEVDVVIVGGGFSGVATVVELGESSPSTTRTKITNCGACGIVHIPLAWRWEKHCRVYLPLDIG